MNLKTILAKPYKIYKGRTLDVIKPNCISDLQNELIDLIVEMLDLFSNKPDILTQKKNRSTGNTNKLGFYIIYNKKTKKFHLGSSIEFSRRISEYNRDFRNYFGKKKSKLYNSFIKDIEANNCSDTDFYFVPIMSFDKTKTDFINLENFVSSVEISNDPQIQFLETIEFYAIEHFLGNVNYNTRLYTKVASSKFTIGNKLRSPTSGSPSKPIKFKNAQFAWESVSLAAQFFNVDRHTIRNKLGSKFEYIAALEFKDWDPNYKITKNNINSISKQPIIYFYKNKK